MDTNLGGGNGSGPADQTNPDRATKGPAPIQALLRGLSILSQFTLATPRLSLSELSSRTGLHRTTVYRFAKTLEAEGYLAFDANSRLYSVGPTWAVALYSLGTSVALGRVLQQDLEALTQATRESVALAVEKSGRIHVVQYLDSASLYMLRGHTHGPHTLGDTWNAGAKLYLAWSDSETIRTVLGHPAVRYTDHTITDPETMERVLVQVRREGIAYELEEHTIGVCAMAAPVIVDSKLVAAVALIAIKERFEKNKTHYATIVKKTAASMAARLGEID